MVEQDHGRLLRDFAVWTTAHGVPHIVKAKTTCIRAVWIIITIASMAVFIYQLVYLVGQYLEYDVAIDMELKFDKETNFPAVTICNLNPYKDSMIKHVPHLKQMTKAYGTRMESNSSTGTADWGFEREEVDSENLNLRAQILMNLLIANYIKKKPVVQVETRDILSRANDVNDTVCEDGNCGGQVIHSPALAVLTYSIDELIKSCTYNDQECDMENDFVKIYDPTFGACYAFNMFDPPKYKITKAGNGLRLVLVSEQREYMELTEAAGIKVSIHSYKEDPFPDSFGYNSAVGMATNFAVKYVQTDHLEPPWGQCNKKMDEVLTNYYYARNKISTEGCYRSCLQDNIIRKCHCADPQYGIPGKGEMICDVQDIDCLIDFYQNEDKSSCICPSPCRKETYSVTVSTALWPSSPVQKTEDRLKILEERDCSPELEKIKEDVHNETCLDWYRSNAMLVEVYFERMNYLRLSEIKAYNWFTLASDIGGQLGLWMGASLITVIEFGAFGNEHVC